MVKLPLKKEKIDGRMAAESQVRPPRQYSAKVALRQAGQSKEIELFGFFFVIFYNYCVDYNYCYTIYTRLSQFLTPQFLTILTILNTFFQNGQFSEVAQEAGKYYFMFTIERWGFEYPVGAGK